VETNGRAWCGGGGGGCKCKRVMKEKKNIMAKDQPIKNEEEKGYGWQLDIDKGNSGGAVALLKVKVT